MKSIKKYDPKKIVCINQKLEGVIKAFNNEVVHLELVDLWTGKMYAMGFDYSYLKKEAKYRRSLGLGDNVEIMIYHDNRTNQRLRREIKITPRPPLTIEDYRILWENFK